MLDLSPSYVSRMYAAKRMPSWFPVKVMYVGLGSTTSELRMAAAKRSASGSEAVTRGMSSAPALAMARSRAPFSSGLGKLTVGKSGLGRACGVCVLEVRSMNHVVK